MGLLVAWMIAVPYHDLIGGISCACGDGGDDEEKEGEGVEDCECGLRGGVQMWEDHAVEEGSLEREDHVACDLGQSGTLSEGRVLLVGRLVPVHLYKEFEKYDIK